MASADRNVIYGWEVQTDNPKLRVAYSEDIFFWDDSGNRYIDLCSSQFNVNLGHRHPRVISAMKKQLDTLVYAAPTFATDVRSELAALISSKTPAGLNNVFFTNSGSESIENAIKVARAVTGRNKIYSAWQSYHGATLGAAAVSGDKRRLFAEPSSVGFQKFHAACCVRCPFGQAGPPECGYACATSLTNQILHDGPESVAAIIIEPIAGTSGVYVWPDEYLNEIQRLCREFGIILIADETITGWGRTGRWFGSEHFGLTPDILATAKGITSGYIPLGALVVTDAIRNSFVERAFVGGLTNEGHALACATALACLQTYEAENLIAGADRLGEHLFRGLAALRARHACITDVRGKGLLACLEIGPRQKNRPPFADQPFLENSISSFMTQELMRRGLFSIVKWNLIFIAPPLIISEQQIDDALDIIGDALQSLDDRHLF